jgi:hypothetical protein
MRQAMNEGTVLFRDGTIFPKDFQCESESSSPGWRSFKGLDGDGLDRMIRNAGWHFFCFAGESMISVVGLEGEKTVHKAIGRIQASLKLEKINSFEITRVAFKTFLGVPYTRLSFRMRNIQESMFLRGDHSGQPWNTAKLTAT